MLFKESKYSTWIFLLKKVEKCFTKTFEMVLLHKITTQSKKL